MKRYKGGCAVMLKLWSEKHQHDLAALSRAAVEWSKGRELDWRPVETEDYHLTLQFIGRNLASDKIASAIVTAFAFADEQARLQIEFTGALSTFATKKGRYLVAHVKNNESMASARKRLGHFLSEMGVAVKDAFEFKPHVTLAEAPPTVPEHAAPVAIEPFSVECSKLIVKYGLHRMVVDL